MRAFNLLVYDERRIEAGDALIPAFYSSKVFDALLIGIVVLSTSLVYWPGFYNDFQTQWDDQWVVKNIYTESGLGWDNFLDILTTFYHGQYSPVSQLYYCVLYSWFGYSPFWFHAFSLVLHLFNSIILYWFLSSLFTRTNYFSFFSAKRICFFTVLMFSIHPLSVEAVEWLSASRVLLYFMFYFLGLLAYLRYTISFKRGYYFCSAFCFIISFGAKEQAVIFPFCLLLLDWITGRDLKSKRIWIEKAPLFILSLFFGYITLLSQAEHGVGVLSDKSATYPFYQSFLFACYAFTEYIIKCLFPVKLLFLYLYPNQIGQSIPAVFWAYPLLILIVLITFWQFFRKRVVMAGILFFLVHFLPVSNLIPMSRHAIIADRYIYTGAIGVFFLAGCLFNYLFSFRKYRRIVLSVAIIYLLWLGGSSYLRCFAWRDSESLKVELIKAAREKMYQSK